MQALKYGRFSRSWNTGERAVPQTMSSSLWAFSNAAGLLIIPYKYDSKIEEVVSDPASIYCK
jgi:hypothetical protein